MAKEKFVSIIIPAYKQKRTIKKDVLNIYDVMSQTRWDFEIIVVDDGSPDDTLKELKQIRKNQIQTLGYATNRGKGYAVRYGMARATGDYIAFIDAGMEISPNSISMLLEHMEWYNADIMVGSKRHPASKVKLTSIRKIYSWGYYLGVRILFGLKISDTQVGLKIFKRSVLEKVMPRLVVKEFAFDIELLAVANRLGFTRIFTAPVQLTLGFSEGSKWLPGFLVFLDPNIRAMVKDTMAVFYRLHLLNYYDDKNQRKWIYDKELQMRINTGELQSD
jgi:glycosyltransferase involved in cell wall biosynthesis